MTIPIAVGMDLTGRDDGYIMVPGPGHHPSDVRQDAAMISDTVVSIRQKIVPLRVNI